MSMTTDTRTAAATLTAAWREYVAVKATQTTADTAARRAAYRAREEALIASICTYQCAVAQGG
jgi:hypothetical protein